MEGKSICHRSKGGRPLLVEVVTLNADGGIECTSCLTGWGCRDEMMERTALMASFLHKAQAGVVLGASWAAVVLVGGAASAKVWGRWFHANLPE